MGNQDVAVKNADGTAKVDADGNPVTEKGKFITGLENTTWKPDEKGYVPDRAATEGQLKDIVGQFDGKLMISTTLNEALTAIPVKSSNAAKMTF